MDFYEVVDQVVKLLQQRGRLTYRSLKLQFQLDDETLEALKDELLFSHPVVDQEGRGVVWTGAAEATPAPVSASPSAQTSQPPTAEEEPPPQVAPLSTEHRIPEAERRQLTVMFCDLVDSTKLSSQLDPEDYRDVVRAYQKVCSEVITRFAGHIAQLLGDGLLVYFGYPQAHEDDAHRAVRTGLGILAAMEDLNTHLQREKGIQLSIRLGIHTGLVVIGEMGGTGRQEQLALGEVPNIASRIEGLAAPNTIAVSEATYRLVQGYFDCQDLGAKTLRGVAEPIAMYRVLSESGATSRLDVAQPRGLTPLVGREQEVGLLLERWEQAKAGHGHVVLLSGEAGIGKSRLVMALKESVAGEPHTRWECRCSSYFQDSALYPLIDLAQRALQFGRDEAPAAKLQKIVAVLQRYGLAQPDSVALWAALLSVPLTDLYPPLHLTPQRQKQQTLEAIVTLLLALAAEQPVLFIVEDLHWIDPSTLELLTLFIDQGPTARLLLLLTCRPEFPPPWGFRAHLTPLTLTRLPQPQVAQMSVCVAGGKALPPEVVEQIVAKTDGVPLFVEELTKTVLESGLLWEGEERYTLTGPLPPLAIPTTLHDSLMARLDRLAMVKEVAQLGATIGRTFAYELLQAVSLLDNTLLQQSLWQLVDAELMYQQGVPPQATYLFKHALIQDAAYQSLLRSTRQQYHQRIAQVLETQFPETTETQPELLAHHYTEAGLSAPAVAYWQRAGQRAIERSANVEAITHLTKGLEILKSLPDTSSHIQQELAFQIALGVPLAATRGFAAPEVEHAYARARELCREVGESPRLFPVLAGLWRVYLVRGEVQTARELGEQLLALNPRAHDPLGIALFFVGELAAALTHLEQGFALYDPQKHRSHAFRATQDPAAACLTYAAVVLWLLGYPERALQRSHQAVTMTQELAHPLSLACALDYAATLHQFRREGHAAHACAEAAVALAAEQGFAVYFAHGMVLRGWARAEQGQAEEGRAQINSGLEAWRTTGAEVQRPYYLALLAEAYGKSKQAEEALEVLAEALALVAKTGECWWEAELYRLRGELLLQQSSDNQVEAETCFHHALEIARMQQAKSFELRAATSLARLWQQQGKRQEAHDLLAPVYNWFTEGFDTADLQDAKALLDELGA
jgi:predicted ATPase/class 3 adenylate cyclase